MKRWRALLPQSFRQPKSATLPAVGTTLGTYFLVFPDSDPTGP
jgi:hypothetical protein